MLVRFLDWLSAFGKSKGLDTFNRVWMIVTLVMIGLMLVGNYFELGSKKSSSESPPAAMSK